MPSLDHAILTLNKARSVRFFSAQDARSLTVRSKAIRGGQPQKSVRYKVTLTRHGSSTEQLPYGLFNLSIQARAWKVKVHEVDGTNVVFTRQNNAGGVKQRGPFDDANQPAANQKTLRRAQAPGTNVILDERLWFINFDGDECVLYLESFRKLRKWPRNVPDGPFKLRMMTEHDWAPPPPDGGGEEGGDDGEDDPEEDGE